MADASGKSIQVSKAVADGDPPAPVNEMITGEEGGVDALWGQMNKGVSTQTLLSILNNNNKKKKKPSINNNTNNWMSYLGLAPKLNEQVQIHQTPTNYHQIGQGNNDTSDEAKKLAAAALAAVKDAAAVTATRGKVEITEMRDFAGQEIEYKKFVDADSKEASKPSASSAVDAVLEHIRKKPKLSVLDKTKKDWGEFKDEHRGVEDELDAYKKSSNQYLDKVSFLHRTEYREFERQRDARLSSQAKRRPDNMREDL